ncbi:MAG: alpha/beta hydrolase [Actinomycetota bacterium]|nr:alpha/beta hydrolase [Actinomycetota bacterium]
MTRHPPGYAAPIHAEVAGDPAHPLVVLVHGSMDRSAGMLRLSRRLDHDLCVVRYDRRGYGRSVPHPGPFDMAAQVDDLVDLLSGRPAIIVGHSYGGNVALTTAARHPHLVRGVVIYESPLSWEPWWSSTSLGARAVEMAHDPEAAAEEFMRRMLGSARWEALPERTRATRRAEGLAMVSELADLRRNRPWRPEEITVPLWIGYGSDTTPQHVRGMPYAAELIPGSHLVMLPGCHHLAPNSHPDLFRHELIDPLLAELATHDA